MSSEGRRLGRIGNRMSRTGCRMGRIVCLMIRIVCSAFGQTTTGRYGVFHLFKLHSTGIFDSF